MNIYKIDYNDFGTILVSGNSYTEAETNFFDKKEKEKYKIKLITLVGEFLTN